MCVLCVVAWCVCFFFFKQKTAYEMRISDWSSDVCSSDLKSPPAAQSASATPSLSFLDSVDLTGTVAIGDLKVKELKATKFAASLRAAQGKLAIDGIKADLYGGKLAGKITADSANALALDASLDNVALGPLLSDLAHEGRLLGDRKSTRLNS